ncbi:MAG: pilus assembly protein N-terminal domain-containing protein [Vicinamibacterales bacterium]
MISAFTTELRKPARIAALVVAIIVILVAAPQAQQGPAFSPSPVTNGAPAAVDAPVDIDLLVGRSTVLNVGATIARVSLTVPDIADALVTAPSQLLIHGKQPGTISLFVWDRGGAIKTYEVKVRRDLTPLIAHVKQLFPGEPIEVRGSGKDVILSGTVSGQYVIDKAAAVAGGYVEKKENVVNLMKQQEGIASNQVLLRVRFAEVSRSALQELGISLFSDGNNNFNGRTTTQQFAAPFFDQQNNIQGKNLVFSDYLNLYVFDLKNQIGAVVKAMQTKGVFQSLAEPNLIALNGKEASFLAGGEFPYPVPTGLNQIAIHFKEFGVRLKFTPTVLGGDLINLKLAPEVSSLDFNNAVVIEGFRVPALTSRRADTEIELRDGQTFAIAGLLNNTALSSMRKVPGIGDIPILGYLFRSRAYQKDQTELVVMVTPTILRKDSTGASEGLPALLEPYLSKPNRTYPNPNPYVGSPRYPSSRQEAPSTNPAPAPAPAAQPQASQNPYSQSPRPATAQPERVVAQPAAPLASRPIQGAPAATPLSAPVTRSAPAAAQPRADVKPVQISEEQRKAIAAQQRRAEQQRMEADRKRAEQAAIDARLRVEQQKKDEEARKLADRLEKERAKREAEVAKRNAEIARKKAEEDAKREKTLAEAADRLKQAQAAYQAELEKAKGSSNDKSKSQKSSQRH